MEQIRLPNGEDGRIMKERGTEDYSKSFVLLNWKDQVANCSDGKGYKRKSFRQEDQILVLDVLI